MKAVITLFTFALLFTLTAAAQESKGTNKQKRKVLNLINSLPEVVESNKFMMKDTVNKRRLKAYLENTPTKAHHYYVVSVSEFNGIKLVPHFWFYVNAGTYAINYWDVLNDKLVPYKLWHKHPYGAYSK